MPSLPWIYVIGLFSFVSVARSQEFYLNNPLTMVVTEGQLESLTINVFRTGSTTAPASVNLRVEEVTDNNRLNWLFPITLAVNSSSLILPLGVADDENKDPDRLYRFILLDPSENYTVGSNAMVLVTYIDNDGLRDFDCTKGDICRNGGVCDTLTRRCDCSQTTPTTAFEDCSLITDFLLDADCGGVQCTRGGVCARDITGESKCTCQPGYTGTTCLGKKRYDVECSHSGMCLNVDPPSAYQGLRYILDYWSVPECRLTPVTEQARTKNNLPAHWEGSFICLDHANSTCGTAKNSTAADGLNKLSREVMIRLGNLRVKSDIVFEGSCKYDTTGSVYIDSPFTIGDNTPVFRVQDEEVVGAVRVSLVNPRDNTPRDVSSFDVGDEICFAFTVGTGTSGYTNLRLDQARANDTVNSASEFTILENGCPVPGQVDVTSGLPYVPDPTDPSRIYFCIEAFAFDNSDNVALSFEVSMCTNPNDTNCMTYTCGVSGRSNGRRRRAAEDKREYLGTTLKIRDYRAIINEDYCPNPPDAPQCSLGWHIILAIAIMTSLAIVLLFVLLVMILRSLRLRKQARGQ